MVFKSSLNNGGGSSGVTSVDSITGAVTLVQGSNITISDNTPVAGSITIAASGGTGTVTTTGAPAIGNIAIFSSATSITVGNLAGDATTNGSPTITLATVNSNIGTYGSANSAPVVTVNAKGLITSVSTVSLGAGSVSTTGSPAVGNLAIFSGSSSITNTNLAGDVTTSGGSTVTLATVNSNIGSFGNASLIPVFTVNAKGLITAATSTAVIAAANLLSGTTLSSTVVFSFLSQVATITLGAWQSTKIGDAYGGTNADSSASTGVAQVSSGTWSWSTALANGTTATTQTAGDNTAKIATDAFVTTAINNAIAGVNPAVAVQFSTTAASDTSAYTYNNGASGIGATLTGANNVAFAADGQTATALLQRVLVKNDTQAPSGAFNGVYYVSQLQTAILPPILTRALDYDQSSDINNTGAIPVVNGTLNASTSWLLTSTVTTVGTDPLTYTKFSINPTTILTNTLASAHIFVGNSSNIATDVALSGAVTITNAGVATVVTNANLTGAVTSIGNATTLIGSVPFSAPSTVAVGNATIYLMTKAAFSGTINSVLGARTTSGTITLAIKINGTNVTGLSAVSVTSTPADTNASAANTFAAGDIITAVTSSASTDLGLSFNIKVTRT